MKLIRKLGTRLNKNGRWQSYGEFSCPFDNKIVERQLSNGYKQKSCGCQEYSEERNKKIAKSMEGKKRKPFSEEQRKNMSEAQKGHLVSEETKQKMRENHPNFTGEKHPNFGKTWTKEHRQKISESNKGKQSREKHWNWKEVKSFEEYPPEFNKELKIFIKQRDNYTCQCLDCNILKETDLHIHHIDYDKSNNNPENLITLCNSCHMKTNYNRQYYTEFYQNIMINRLIECLL